MKAMIFAAGLGTRLRPITDSRPKALVTVAGQTLLERNINSLKAFGFDHIVVNVHHFPQMIADFLASRDWGIKVQLSDESNRLLDTGGGLKKALPLFNDGTPGPILLHNVDILSNANLRRFYLLGTAYPAALLVSSRETSRYLLFDDDMNLAGWTNIATGQVRSPYGNINPDNYHRFAFSGIHLFSPTLATYMDSFPDAFPIIDFYLALCRKVKIKGIAANGLKLLDVGKINALKEAEEFVEEIQTTNNK